MPLVNNDEDELIFNTQKTWLPRVADIEPIEYDRQRPSTWKPSQRKAAVRESAKHGMPPPPPPSTATYVCLWSESVHFFKGSGVTMCAVSRRCSDRTRGS